MTFKKWTSIENHYQNKTIDHFMMRYGGELNKVMYAIFEKIDGANFSATFYPEGRWQFARRSGMIPSDETFYDYKSAFQTDDMRKFFELVSVYCMAHKRTLQFVGELYGQGIQKRIYYGPDKYWRYYAVYEHISGDEVNLLTLGEMQTLVDNIAGSDIKSRLKIMYAYNAPILKIVTGLEEALKFDININSTLTPEGYDKENLMEGIVIRPIDKDYFLGLPDESSMLILKKKNPNFDDKNKVKKERVAFNVSEDLQSLYDKTIGYVNENRTADLYSKFGMIPAITFLGRFIGHYMKDVHSDIMKDYPLDFDNLSKNDQKWLMKQFTPLIKAELMKDL
jgi:Rnl2 family RNA ligase